MTQFFAELKDAPQNPSLALCAATVLFVLSQDRLVQKALGGGGRVVSE